MTTQDRNKLKSFAAILEARARAADTDARHNPRRSDLYVGLAEGYRLAAADLLLVLEEIAGELEP